MSYIDKILNMERLARLKRQFYQYQNSPAALTRPVCNELSLNRNIPIVYPRVESSGFSLASTEQVYNGLDISSMKRNGPNRIVVPNVVYLMNLPQISLIEDILKSPRFLGQYGKIEKIIVHKNCTAHVTFATAVAAQLCIQSLHNFNFDGSKISAKVGTTKYPQDVDLAKIAANNKLEPPPPICLDPIFPPPPVGSYRYNELKFMNNLDVVKSNTYLEFPALNILSSDSNINNEDHAKMVEFLISPLDSERVIDNTSDGNFLVENELLFGTGGLHHAIWANNQDHNTSQHSSAFVPCIREPVLNLTEIETKTSPRYSVVSSTSMSPMSSSFLSPTRSPSTKTIIKLNSFEVFKDKKFQSPRGIDELQNFYEANRIDNVTTTTTTPPKIASESRLFTTYLPSSASTTTSPTSTHTSKTYQDIDTLDMNMMTSFQNNESTFHRSIPQPQPL